MPLEIEAKMKIESVARMTARLQDRGAIPVGRYLETNTFYDTDDRAMLAADQGLRLRIAKDLTSGEILCVLTHKGPNQHGPLKSREETELSVGSAEEAARLLERLGFQRYLSFQKLRNSWKFEGCKVEVDEVPYLGSYIEIEGPNEETIMRVRETLGLSSLPLIKASYVAMLTAYLQERGKMLKDIEFEDETVAKAG